MIFHLDTTPLRNGALSVVKNLPGVRQATHNAVDGKSEIDLILDADDVLGSALSTLTTHGAHVINLQKREPTLEDVFVELVGMSITEAEKVTT